MGTTYTVKVNTSQSHYKNDLKSGLDSILVKINNRMSTYIPDSEIMQFNNLKVGESVLVSDELIMILEKSYDITEMTDRAFDISVGPLVELWGFGFSDKILSVPNKDVIDDYVKKINIIPYKILDNNQLFKTRESTLDLSAIAKGYAVDVLSSYLLSLGLFDHMVDIGGEVYCSGENKNGDWSIGIQYPDEYIYNSSIDVISLSDKAVATSGNYRNKIVIEGVPYTHIINPKTGYPITHDIISATVIADNCMTADAYATALMVMEKEQGKEFIESKDNTEAVIFYRDKKNIKSLKTDGFNVYEN